MKLTVNGVPRDVASPPLKPLLHVLRDELDITGPKAGCQQGGCGTCSVLVDGEPRRSCLLPLAALEGAEVTTVEGLGQAGDLAAVQEAFHDGYAAQCGFCTPGMLVASHALLQRTSGPLDDAEIAAALGGHFCRCTGYVKIVGAIREAAQQNGGTARRSVA
jgi:aerobic-type carbon monoxide dehydrogenase small subunit (CoxS/CutS family)